MQQHPGHPQGYHHAPQPQPAGGWGGGYGGHGGGHGHFPPVHLEFSPADDATLQKVSDRTRRWGITSMIGGGLLLLMALSGIAFALNMGTKLGPEFGAMFLGIVVAAFLPTAIVYLSVGVFYMRSAESIGAIATTQGHDLPHLMEALQKLRVAFQIEVIVGIVAFAGGFIAALALAASS